MFNKLLNIIIIRQKLSMMKTAPLLIFLPSKMRTFSFPSTLFPDHLHESPSEFR